MLDLFLDYIQKEGIPTSKNPNPVTILTTDSVIAQWNQ